MIEEVVEGWWNYARHIIGIDNEEVEVLAKIRGEICLACPSVGKKQIMCGECGCSVKAKIRAEGSVCPLGKW